jgi:hypothetical protein
MPEHEAWGRAVYDHDNEDPRATGRRRRQVADWGVGEELFDHMPGRRFERRPHQEIPRGDAGDGRRTIVIETGEDEPAVAPSGDEEFASREEALRAREVDDELWAGEEPFADERALSAEQAAAAKRAAAADSWAAAHEPWIDDEPTGDASQAVADSDELAAPEEPSYEDGIVRGGQEGRRTVKIGGRPAEFHGPPARARQRPPRTMHERLGPRPDRVAMWAFALGLLLILIAIATANA